MNTNSMTIQRLTSISLALGFCAGLMFSAVGEMENQRFKGTDSISQENGCYGFIPAFLDSVPGTAYLYRFADGRMAPIHLLAGLPDELVSQRSTAGRVTAVKNSVMAGLVRCGRFYTRDQAARAVTDRKEIALNP
jgi:hypothetical protein